MLGEFPGAMPPANDDATPDPVQARVAQYELEIQEKNRRLAMLEEENEIRRLREMRQTEERERERMRPADDDISLDPEAAAVLDKLMERKMRSIKPMLDKIEARNNQLASEIDTAKIYAETKRLAPFLDEVGPRVVEFVNRLPASERQAILSSPNAMASLATVIHGHMKTSQAQTETEKARAGGVRPGALGGTRQIGNQQGVPDYRAKIQAARPGSPEWYEAKKAVEAERKRQLANS